jgi:hypothetical protein
VCAAYTGVAWISAPAAVAAAAVAAAAVVAAAAAVAAAVAAAAVVAAAAASAEWGQTAVTVEPDGWRPYAGGSGSVAARPSTAEKDSHGEVAPYGPMIYTLRNAFDASISITRASERGQGPEIEAFLDPVKWHRTLFEAQKSRDFQGSTPSHLPK